MLETIDIIGGCIDIEDEAACTGNCRECPVYLEYRNKTEDEQSPPRAVSETGT
jgi:hypothetical protein